MKKLEELIEKYAHCPTYATACAMSAAKLELWEYLREIVWRARMQLDAELDSASGAADKTEERKLQKELGGHL